VLINIAAEQEGITVYTLTRRLGISRRNLIRLKNTAGGIQVNGSPVTVRCVLHTGDTVYLAIEDGEDGTVGNILPGENLPRVLWESEQLIAYDKPPGMPTHPSHGHMTDSLGSAACKLWQERGEPFVFRPVNRLDRDTSGVVLTAKTQHAAWAMSRRLQAGAFSKKYIAVLDGTLEQPEGEIVSWIVRKTDSVIERVVTVEGKESDYALTRYRTFKAEGGRAIVEASPITGRTHQLRVHFAWKGVPILGDDLYGRPSEEIARQALHAYSLTFPNPFDGEREVNVTSPIPDDMRRVSEYLRNFNPLRF